MSAGPEGLHSISFLPSKNLSTISDTTHSCSKHNGPIQISTTALPQVFEGSPPAASTCAVLASCGWWSSLLFLNNLCETMEFTAPVSIVRVASNLGQINLHKPHDTQVTVYEQHLESVLLTATHLYLLLEGHYQEHNYLLTLCYSH